MTDITEFLLARIAEDEEAARVPVSEYEEGEGWYGEQSRTWLRRHLDPFDQVEDNDSRGYPTVDFIIRNSPARVLAECEAKRRIVEFHQQWPVLVEGPQNFDPVNNAFDNFAYRVRQQMEWLTTQQYIARFGHEPPTTPMLRALASVYSDHPDFDPSWA